MLETERLVIREMCPDDVEAIYSIYAGNDLSYMEGLYEDRDREREYIKDYQKYIYSFYDFGIWLFEEKETGDIIGRGGVEHKVYKDGTEGLELGYIIRKDKQRQGYAYEGMSAILIYVREHFAVSRLKVSVHRENVSSIGLAKKLGAEFEKEQTTEYITGIIEFID